LALNLLRVMPEAKFQPNQISYNAAISACEKAGEWQQALTLLSLMPEVMVVPNEITYNAAISACEKGYQWQLALNLLSLMPEARLKLTRSLTTPPSGHAKIHLLSLMPAESGAKRDHLQCRYQCLLKGQPVAAGIEFASLMPAARVVPDEITHSAAISACDKGGQWQLAITLLSLMPEPRGEPWPEEVCGNSPGQPVDMK
jgi:pentatricopeptide repeat domain-containing protein 1